MHSKQIQMTDEEIAQAHKYTDECRDGPYWTHDEVLAALAAARVDERKKLEDHINKLTTQLNIKVKQAVAMYEALKDIAEGGYMEANDCERVAKEALNDHQT